MNMVLVVFSNDEYLTHASNVNVSHHCMLNFELLNSEPDPENDIEPSPGKGPSKDVVNPDDETSM
jgi:hypothetical protein